MEAIMLRPTMVDPRLLRKWFPATLVVVLILLFTSLEVLAYDFIGGASSVKVLSTNGNPLTIGRSGVVDSSIIIGLAPTVSILAPTVSGKSATLRGNVSDMNGFPSANVYFEWGYNPGSLTNTTPTQVIAGTGTYTANIITDGPTEGTVYYRFYAEADGTSYAGSSFNTIPLHPVYWLLKVLPLVFVAITLLILAIGFTTGSLEMVILSAILTIIGAVGAGVIWQLVANTW